MPNIIQATKPNYFSFFNNLACGMRSVRAVTVLLYSWSIVFDFSLISSRYYRFPNTEKCRYVTL